MFLGDELLLAGMSYKNFTTYAGWFRTHLPSDAILYMNFGSVSTSLCINFVSLCINFVSPCISLRRAANIILQLPVAIAMGFGTGLACHRCLIT